MSYTHYVLQCVNRSNDDVINDHLHAINSCASQALDMFCVTSSPRHELKSKFYKKKFIVILWLFAFSALLLRLAFANSSCRIYPIANLIIEGCYELMC